MKKTVLALMSLLMLLNTVPSWVFADFDVASKFQPNYESPRKYTRQEMELMARDAISEVEVDLGVPFNRKDPHHVGALAEFFDLTQDDNLDLYSSPMEDADIRYFADVARYREKELYPLTDIDLAIRFYWEGLARIVAEHMQMQVVNERWIAQPEKTRGKVSDMATTAMFEKRPGMTIAEAVAEGKERYDFARLLQHLKVKGLSSKEN